MAVRPHATERTGADGTYFEMYSAVFEVACDSCRVEYGKEGETFRDVTEGDWSRAVSLGTLRTGQSARVVLRIRPIEATTILDAKIEVDGRTLASTKNKKPGQSVDLWATVRAR
jgi:hypothetical protein